MKRAIAALGMCFLLVGCAGAATVATVGPGQTQSADGKSLPPPATQVPSAAAPSQGGIKTYRIGDVIDVTGRFSSDVRITVVEVKSATKYGDYSTPKAGNIYLAVKYEYESLEDGATYNQFDWQVFVDGTAVENFTFVVDGPEPQLSSGTLPMGRKASGWVVYEVPRSGEVLLSYGGMFSSDGPVFEVVARET